MSTLELGDKPSKPRPLALALDIGGSKVAAAVVDSQCCVLHRRHELWSTADGWERLEQTIRIAKEVSALAGEPITGAGVGVPAVVDQDGAIECAPNLACWNGLPLRRLLSERLETPCTIGHDGQLATLGEYWYGAGKGAQSLAMVVIGTGIGGGFVVDGKLYGGASGMAATGLGWVVPDRQALNPKDHANDGSLEARAGGRGLESRTKDLMAEAPTSRVARLAEKLPDGAGARALFLAAERGDSHAIGILKEAGDLIAILVANLVTILSPEVVALGGTIGLHGMMLARAQAVTASYSMPSCRQATTIVTAQLGGDAGLLGAAHQVFAGR